LNPLAAVYGRVTALRRTWYARHPDRQQRLPRPVISVGNLVAGGSGKTPVVAALARLLLRAGERPAILSRGYGRRTRADDAVIVSDGRGALVPVRDSGDEPQMLARMLPEVPIVVCARRYRAGAVAASRFDVTVMLLDDGFQHLELARDIDLIVVSPADLDEQLLPSGRLRESLAASAAADAVIVPGSSEETSRVAAALQVSRAFSVVSRYEPFRALARDADVSIAPGSTALAVAGIARPERFFDALEACDLRVVCDLRYADHHWFDAGDVSRIERTARDRGASLIVTTEKDAVRLAGMTLSMPWVTLPQQVSLIPEADFIAWMRRRLDMARESAAAAAASIDE
jgi:tetraacyldisaccharide 4'-kinase